VIVDTTVQEKNTTIPTDSKLAITIIEKTFKFADKLDIKLKQTRMCGRRAAIEPVISYLKHDCRMLRNFLKGAIGDKINAKMAGVAFNFRIVLKEIKQIVSFCLHFILRQFPNLKFSNFLPYKMRVQKIGF